MKAEFADIDNPSKLKSLSGEELAVYADWLRNYLIGHIAEYGGHFAANLGVIELTIALHYVYDAPEDVIIWDVGHQAYAHKVLTDRKKDFHTLRKFQGLSGFPKMSESAYDAFGTGHSSTSISAALGYAAAAKLNGIERHHVAVIGDGAMSAGQAFEALNNAAVSDTNLLVIINDNHIGIDPSQGALGEYLEKIDREKNLFTEFGYSYYGPVDGHSLPELLQSLNEIKEIQGPKILHIRTLKGKGYKPAELEQTKWHSTSRFDKLSGKNTAAKSSKIKFQDIFGKTLLELAEKDKQIVAVTPAMISGSSLQFMQEKFPERVFDVGIAEQHAVTFAAGMAASGMTPFCCIYSTFLQRAYDQFIHDVALQKLPVIFAIDRAGLVGEDGPTHHGVFDIAFLQTIPNVCIISPRNQKELRSAMYTAAAHKSGPFVIRYPRGSSEEEYTVTEPEVLLPGKGECIRNTHSGSALLSVGTIWKNAQKAIDAFNLSHYNLRYVKPLDSEMLKEVFEVNEHVFILEEGQLTGGVSGSVALLAEAFGFGGKLHYIGIDDSFTPHGDMKDLYELTGLDEEGIYERVKSALNS